MAILRISNFSCIKSAEISLGDLTILIGPQASGKSVLSKLIYFCYDVFEKQYRFLEEEAPLREFISSLEVEFTKVFPAVAWGRGKFDIFFQAGPFELTISGYGYSTGRRVRRERIRMTFSDYFVEKYEAALLEWRDQKQKSLRKSKRNIASFEIFWRFQETEEKVLKEELGDDFVRYKVFIPAGRSFFTSLGKAISVFEHGGILDPITVEFGRYFSSFRDRFAYSHYTDEEDVDQRRSQKLMKDFFGGSIEITRDEAFVHTEDGRKVPFGFLSSGQQELLPLWLVIDEMPVYGGHPMLTFIEEPEAHLFPSSQADVTTYLASRVSNSKYNNKIVITTHSPYVLASVNNLVRAGDLAMARPSIRSEINKIIRRDAWLTSDRIKAYALKDGQVVDIFRDGLIDGDYIDEVSGDIAEKFSRLLELESE